ncbi:hypothetical protein JW968_06300 [Candidatus Woesearchaeota archaeon]|nr:hypothetical protein [Candidatus Woesearchaeota archaeon]
MDMMDMVQRPSWYDGKIGYSMLMSVMKFAVMPDRKLTVDEKVAAFSSICDQARISFYDGLDLLVFAQERGHLPADEETHDFINACLDPTGLLYPSASYPKVRYG